MRLLKMKETDRTFLESYLTAPSLKAMARSSDGMRRRYFFNARNIEGVRKSALESCTRPDDPCEIVMENAQVVAPWALQPDVHKPADQPAVVSTRTPVDREPSLTGVP